LATFYVFDKEGNGTSPMVQLVGHGCGGCGGGYWCWINGVRTWCPYNYGY
jgi:hypothetical protein